MSVLDRLRARRDALLASPRFRAWAAAFPLTRPIARRRSRDLFDLCAGFVYSQTLLAVVRLGVLERLRGGPTSMDALATAIGLTRDRAERLVTAAAALRLVRVRRDGRVALGPLGAPLVGNPAVLAMVEHNALLYGDLADPVVLLRDGEAPTSLARYWPYADADEGGVAGYSTLMAASLSLVAEEVLAAYPVARHRCLLDVGGGEGRFLELVAERAPAVGLMLYDLPPVAARAAKRLAASGLSARATVHAGDFLAQPLPAGADLITLLRVLHDHPDDDAGALLRRCRAALPAGGRLVVAEPLAGASGAGRVGSAYFGFDLLAMGRGRARSAWEYGELLGAAGFREVRDLGSRMPVQAGVLTAVVY